MSAATLISPEEYLATKYEWEPEYVHGELVERPMPTYVHSAIGYRIEGKFETAGLAHGHDVRCKLEPGVFRLPDVAAWTKRPTTTPVEEVPLVVVEILSPDDRYADLLDKLREYQNWGVPHIWVVDPMHKLLQVFRGRSLTEADALSIPEHNLSLTAAEIFPEPQG
ncbi:MAG: Uma2 family endonuclease [Bryobacteraceae bacterium]|nr:Uma2 family endonuclease [Bryobacteraceae bacterium]